MTVPTDAQDEVARRTERVIAAALRAAYAWTHRHEQPEAMQEIARMTGVVMEAHGPGSGPTSPTGLVDLLRGPLSGLTGFADGAGSGVGNVVLIDTAGHLSDDAISLAAEYADPLEQVFQRSLWLPRWTRMRSQQVRREVFQNLIEAGDADGYVRARRFLIEHPAGTRAQIQDALRAPGVRNTAAFDPLQPEQQFPQLAGRWWWPCPHCAYPMTVADSTVRCRYRPHRARYRIGAQTSSQSAPRLVRIDDDMPKPRAGGARRPRPREVADTVCVGQDVWRSIVVPGVTELRIAEDLIGLGARVDMWPDFDTYDLDIAAGHRQFKVDVKEYSSPSGLIKHLRERRPPTGVAVLLPRTHADQQPYLGEALPGVRVVTEQKLRRDVRRALSEDR